MSVNIKTESGLEKIAGNYAGSVTKEAIGLGNVDNTSDANKPISTATQTALDNKEDSSNKVSGWQPTPDDDHYPSEKLVKDSLDDKVTKTKVSSSNETTSVINVDDEKAQMAMVAKISGKTVKIVQLVDSVLSSVNGLTLNASVAKIAGTFTYKLNHVYMMSAVCNVNNIRFQTDGKYGMAKIDDSKSMRLKKFTCTHDDFSEAPYIYNTGSSASVTGNFLIFDLTEMGIPSVTEAEFANMFPTYVPTGSYLWNAPVDSVVSLSKNLIEYTIDACNISSTGGIQGGVDYKLNVAKVNTGEKYAIGKGDDSAVYAFFREKPKEGMTSYNGTRYADVEPNFTAPIDGWVVFRCKRYYSSAAIVKGDSVPTDITPYPNNKTTALVPQEIKNLPDYGCGIDDDHNNIVNIDTGLYEHSCIKDTLGNHNYSMPIANLFFTGEITNCERGICSKYTFSNVNATDNTTASSLLKDKEFTYRHGTNDRIYFKDSDISTAADFKTTNANVEIVYHQPTTTQSISSYIGPLPVENGGTITLVNEHNIDINSTIKYKKEVN